MVSPLILLSMFVYFHLYLQRLWEDFSHLPAIFPDGKRLDQKTYPWLLNGLVRRHFEKLRGGRTLTAHMEEIVTILVSWYMVPFTLFIFWFAYLRSQHVEGLISIGALLVASMMLANGFYRRAKQTLRTTEENPFSLLVSWVEKDHARILRFALGEFLDVFLGGCPLDALQVVIPYRVPKPKQEIVGRLRVAHCLQYGQGHEMLWARVFLNGCAGGWTATGGINPQRVRLGCAGLERFAGFAPSSAAFRCFPFRRPR